MTELNRDAMEYINELTIKATGDNRVLDVDDKIFFVNGNGGISEYKPDDRAELSLSVHTLSAVVDYIQKTAERSDTRLIVQVVDEGSVKVLGELDGYGRRELLLECKAYVPAFRFGSFMDSEQAIIQIQSLFVPTDNRALLLKYIGNLVEDNTVTKTDDGANQVTVVRSGVANKAIAEAPNPIDLQPYRTFVEVAQPESSFIFRLHERMQVALFESDGGQWRNEAVANVANFLRAGLDSVKDRVTVLA